MYLAKSDDDLMRLIAAGNREAFQALYVRYNGMVFGFCLRFFSGNRSRAEDVSQEVWIRVARFARTYSSENKFKAWICQITRNSALNEIRKNQVSYESSHMETEEIADEFSLEDSIAERYNESRIRKAIEDLPDAQRIAILHWIDGDNSYENIAKQLQCGVSAVRSLLFRAKQNLINRLKETA